MNVPLVSSFLLSTFVVSHLCLPAVVAQSPQQDRETSVAVDRRFSGSRLRNNEDRDTAKNWKEATKEWIDRVRRWNSEDEVLAGTDKDDLTKLSESMEKRQFDTLGGGVIPIKRLAGWKRTFDSLGGGLIPPRKRKSTVAKRNKHAATKSYKENFYSTGDKVRRQFDSLGGGLIPPRKKNKKAATGQRATKKDNHW